MSRWQLINGDSRTELTKLADNSIDSIVTDPPYELGFMGKSWDATGIAYDVNLWRECLRVLKPGGHILAFSGSRTYHRMAVAIEDAGFEIRDQIMWVYGSGFPKSLDVSKAIDKRGGKVAGFEQFRDAVKDAMKRNGVSRTALTKALGNHMLSHYLTDGSQPAVPNTDDYRIIRNTVGLGDEWDHLFLPEAEREVIGVKLSGIANKDEGPRHTIGAGKAIEVDVTAPATDAAKHWEGWGTALKPAHEPIVLARKPLIGTVANNVLQHGTGALNIEASRIPSDDGFEKAWDRPIRTNIGAQGNTYISNGTQHEVDISANRPSGRWPANLIHDGSDEVLQLFPDSKGGAYPAKRGQAVATSFASGQETEGGYRAMGDSGSAARFFYCAKANKRDRNEGLDHLTPQREADRPHDNLPGGDNPRNRTDNPRLNHHPTVKPTELMRYLCRLITPPNGIILDPFTGSGSTGKAAILEHFQFIGIEQHPDYITIAQARIQHTESTLQ